MKKLLHCLCCLFSAFVFFCNASGQCSFKALGPDDRNQLSRDYGKTAASVTSLSGSIYVVYADGANAERATVKKYNGTRWETVGGAGFSADWVDCCDIAISAAGIPYVVYQDGNQPGLKATVARFNGSGWETVGNPGFTPGEARDIMLELDNAGTPYVSFKDYANGSKITVMKFDGSNWVIVGTAGFSAGEVLYPSLSLSSAGLPYVAYSDATNGNKATVMRYNGSSWVLVGAAGFTPGAASFVSLDVSFLNTPFIAYTDGANGDRASVMRFNGSNWIQTGPAGFSAGTAYTVSLTVNGLNQPYVSYRDGANGDKATVMRFHLGSWAPIGTTGFSDGAPDYLSVNLDASEFPYVVYADPSLGNTVTMMQFNNTVWTRVGSQPSFSAGDADRISVVLNKQGTPHVAYSDGSRSERMTVMRQNGNNWEAVGPTGFSPGRTSYPSLTFDANNIPYVAFGDLGSPYFGKTTVMKYTGGSWQVVGNRGFSDYESSYTSIAIDNAGVPYVAYQEQFQSGAVVMKFNGSNWVPVGTPGFSGLRATHIKLAISNTGTLYTAFQDEANGFMLSVMKFNGTSWEYVGGPGMSGAEVMYLSFALDAAGNPWVAYMDQSAGYKATVKKFNGTAWVNVGNPGFSGGTAYYISLAVDPGGTPYVAYEDETADYKATVMTFNGNNWQAVDMPGVSENSVYFTSVATNSSGTPILAINDNLAWVKMLQEPPATVNSSHTIDLNAPFTGLFKNGCNPIAIVKPGAINGISGNTTAKVWIENVQPEGFVKRHFEIAPVANLSTATGIVTLYFTQAEFDAFNAVNSLKLPAGPGDAAGIANLRIEKRAGTSTDHSGMPYTYTGQASFTDPPDSVITWNSFHARWEITIPVTGFGGFFVGTSRILNFNICSGAVHTLTASSAGATYQWQADNGSGFTNISNSSLYSGVSTGTLTITGLSSSNSGIRYRCVVNGVPGPEYTVTFELRWLGITSTNWFTGSNWSGCGTVPDSKTDVIIPAGRVNYPVINTGTTVRSVKAEAGASVTVQTGATLTIIR